MSKILRALAASASLSALAACATAPEPTRVAAVGAVPPSEPAGPAIAGAAAPAVAEASAHDRLFQLFKDSDEASLKRNPFNAIFRGDMRYAHTLGDGITDEYYAAERAAAEAELQALRAIPATSSMQPTSSPTTCSNMTGARICAGSSRRSWR